MQRSHLQLQQSPESPTQSPSTQEPGTAERAGIRIEYGQLHAGDSPPGLLAAVRFGAPAQHAQAAVCENPALDIHVALESWSATPCTELWWAPGPVVCGRQGAIRFARAEDHLAGIIECDERDFADLHAATEAAYGEIRRFQEESQYPYLLRMWNYLDAITGGAGDAERYRQFCAGRAAGLGTVPSGHYPAASALGRQHTTHRLQVYWLAGRQPGLGVENPRQVSAWRYPRQHGPVAPSFARATALTCGTLLISGTASIVGHLSRHPRDPLAQLDETLRNLDSLLGRAGLQASRDEMLLKVYLRDTAHLPAVAERLHQAHPRAESLILAADICRRELLLEIECVARR